MKIADKSSAKSENSELHDCVRWLARLCRWIGIFPVEGLQYTSISRLKFNLRCFYGIYYIFTMITLLIALLTSIAAFFMNEFSLGLLSSVVLNVFMFFETAILSQIARKWSYLMKRSVSFERDLSKIRTIRNTAARKCKNIVITFTITGVVQRLLYKIFVLDFVKRCMGETSITTLVFRNHITTMSPDIFMILDYNAVSAIYSEIVSFRSFFIYNNMDVLVMVISFYLTSYFRDINKLIEKQKNNKSADWDRIRTYFSKVVCMVQLCDRYLSFIVLLSMTSNIYFICLHLFSSFNLSKVGYDYCESDDTIYGAMHCPLYYIYFLYSFTNLVARVFMMALLAANVHSASQAPKYALGEVHSTVYGLEIERFYRQISYTNIGIGGIFYNVTRELVLEVFATLITYEMVMIQFANIETKKNPVVLNDTAILSNNTHT